MTKKSFSMALIVPIYNALDDVKLCLASIVENIDFCNTKVILVDDFSDEDVQIFLNDFAVQYPDVFLLRNEENLGFVKSCNKAMQSLTAEIYILLNSDTIIPNNFELRVKNCFLSSDKIGIASPIASYSDHYCIPMKNNTLEQVNFLLQKKHKPCYYQIPSAEGFCFCIRNTVVEKIGYLDEIYGKGYHEEVDYCYRALENGFICALIDDLYVYHKRHASFGKKERLNLISRNDDVFFQRWQGFREKYIKDYKLTNPMRIIKFKIGFYDLNFFKDKIKKIIYG